MQLFKISVSIDENKSQTEKTIRNIQMNTEKQNGVNSIALFE